MKKLVTALCAGAVVALAAMPASAGVNQRQHNQQRRIYQGVRSGELTNREATGLERQQNSIAREEARFRRRDGGGPLTGNQRARLAYRQDRASANIYDQKHDAQTRPPY